MTRKLYIIYRKDRKHDAFVENVVDYLLKMKLGKILIIIYKSFLKQMKKGRDW